MVKVKLFLFGLAIVALMLVVSVSLLPSPDDRFTELYFDKSNDLPRVVPLLVPTNFTFIIHNVEGVDKEYPYTVTASNGLTNNTIEDGTLVVLAGAQETESVSLIFAQPYNRTLITVALPEQRQSIHFWITPS